ncbi:MAG: O-antigen ligase family protein [Deltaproteobacteria bacterium]|jgi:O-antigen ligase|nr:O-antigen ligase family protein [Deltaproteobacteria bacterium]
MAKRKGNQSAHSLCAMRCALCTRYAIYALLIFTPLARGSVQGWAVSVIYLVTLIALTAFLLEKSLTWNWKWINTPFDKPIIFLLVLLILSTVFSVHKYTSIWSLVLLLNYLTIYYLVIHTVRTRTQFRQLVYIIIGIATFLSIFGIFKRFGVNPFPWWEYPDLKYSADLLSSTYGNHNHLAGYMEMAIPLILGLFLTGLRGGRLILMIFLVFIMLTALILSLSRGGWIGSLIGLVFMAIALVTNRHFRNKRLIAALAGGFLALALVVLASTPVVERIRTFEQKKEIPNLSARVTVWNGVVDMILDHPLLGTGPGTFATVFTQYQPQGLLYRNFMAHNDYLHFTSELGLPFFAIIVWIIIVLYKKGFQKLKNSSRLVRGITVGAMAGITAILIHSISDFNLHIPANALLFTVLAALVAAPLPQENSNKFHRTLGTSY